MNSQPEVYSKNKPSFTNYVVNSGFTMFGEKLQEKLDEAGIKAAELARRSGVTKQNIGRLLNNTPHSITGALPKAEKPTVEKLAKALNWNLDDALIAAGYAPENSAADNSHEILEGVTINFQNGKGLSKKQQQKLLDTVKTLVVGIKAQEEEESE